MSLSSITQRHIQDYTDADTLEHHWGYADRVIPCTNDAGSCEYLDVVYSAHDRGMMYTGIFWLTVAAILISCGSWRLKAWLEGSPLSRTAPSQKHPPSFASRLHNTISAVSRRFLMPETASRPMTAIFGHTTRLQLLVLAMLVGYLSIWSFVGITYNTWITPVKASPGVYNHRSSVGPWADRVGVLAYALTPLSIMLGARESLLSTLTGVPYQSFLFLHRWVGYVIVIQSILHTMGWCLVEARYYQPQPTVWAAFVAQKYIIWGFVAFVLLLLLLVFTFPFVYNRLGGYETFRKAHYILAMVYIGAAIGHWKQLACFLIPSIGLWGIDRGLRLVRSFILHNSGQCPGKQGSFFAPTPAHVSIFEDPADGDIVRLDFHQPEPMPFEIGKHYYLTFTEGSIWQSHPFTPLNDPEYDIKQVVTDEFTSRERHTLLVPHSYIFRAKGGETKKIAQLVANKIQLAVTEQTTEKADNSTSPDSSVVVSAASSAATTPVILTGPYGQGYMDEIADDTNIICVAGGTGITFVLPVLLRLARAPAPRAGKSQRKLRLIWAIRRQSALSWIAAELQRLRDSVHDIQIDIYVTDEQPDAASQMFAASPAADDSSSSGGEEKATTAQPDSASASAPASVVDVLTHSMTSGGRPDLPTLVSAFTADTITGPTAVVASGPTGMITTLRKAVAESNVPFKVWKGDMRHSVRLIVDDRIE